MSVDRYPDRVSVRLPRGWRERIERMADEAERTPASWLRDLLRRALDSGDRAERRRKAAE